ncbi:MAG: phospholipase D-like domain-containing protein [Candidatus Pacebacteria bacterium]|nr:phospholipase D-like domain-containing protein [Candidatus Paceibacterota bacterium]
MSLIHFVKSKLTRTKKYLPKIAFFAGCGVLLLFILSFIFNGRIVVHSEYQPRKEIISELPFEAEIYFNDLDNHNEFGQRITDVITSANEYIGIAMYSFNDEKLIKLLEQKHQSGIEVVVILPKNKGHIEKGLFSDTSFKILEVGDEQETDVTDSSLSSFMHHKFIITDPELDSGEVLFGSTNLTEYQQKFDSNFFVVTSDNHIKQAFVDEFRLLEQGRYSTRKFKKNFAPFTLKGQWSDGFFELWLGPGFRNNSLKQRMIDAINDAESTIDIIGWRINDRDIYRALQSKALEGVTIRIILDDYYMWNDISVASNRNSWHENITFISDSYKDVLFQNDIIMKNEYLPDTFNSFLHHHTMIIDDTILVAGSNNWGYRGFYLNDELAFVTDDTYLVNRYIEEFNYLDKQFLGRALNVQIDNEDNLIFNHNISDYYTTVYVEQSYPDWLGYTCQKILPNEDKKIQEKCITDTTRIFVHDVDYQLYGSSYLSR